VQSDVGQMQREKLDDFWIVFDNQNFVGPLALVLVGQDSYSTSTLTFGQSFVPS
jgi:hypothetical protein